MSTPGPDGSPAQRKRTRWLPILGGLAGVLVLLGVLVVVLGNDDPEVGDCVAPEGTRYTAVDCDAAEAQYRVVGTDDDRTGTEFESTPAESMCNDVPSTTVVLWSGDGQDDDGQVLCAAAI